MTGSRAVLLVLALVVVVVAVLWGAGPTDTGEQVAQDDSKENSSTEEAAQESEQAGLVDLCEEPHRCGTAPDMSAPTLHSAECAAATGSYYPANPTWPATPIGLPDAKDVETLCKPLMSDKCHWEKDDTSVLHTTGLALAPIQCSGDECDFKDVIVSNGNDRLKQRLYLFDNVKGTIDTKVDWYSCDTAYYGNLAAGDYDGDGDIDIAVATFMDKGEMLDAGSVKLYRNNGSGLERCPFDVIKVKMGGRPGGVAVGVDLGDADGDAKLDLIVAIGGRLAQKGHKNMAHVRPAKSLLYYNTGKADKPFENATVTKNRYYTGDAEFADVDGDGLMDVALANRHAMVYHGQTVSGKAQIPLHGSAKISKSKERRRGSYAVAVGKKRGDDGLLPIAWSPNATEKNGGTSNKPQKFRVYGKLKDGAVWSSKSEGSNSKLLLADVTGNGISDLIATRWDAKLASVKGDHIRIYKDVTKSGASQLPDYCSATKPVAQEVALADLDRSGIQQPQPYLVPAGEEGADPRIATIPGRVERITKVTDPSGATLDAKLYTHVPGRSWVAFVAEQEIAGLKIHYETSAKPDLVVNDWSKKSSVSIFEHQ